MTKETRYTPLLAGKTSSGRRVVLYTRDGGERDELYILRPDDSFAAMSLGSKIQISFVLGTDKVTVSIASPEWTSIIHATREDLNNAEPR